MINKRKFNITNNQKKLHKVGKHWVVISTIMLALLGGSVSTTVSANSKAHHAKPHTKHVVKHHHHRKSKHGVTVKTINHKAKNLHKKIMRHSIRKNVSHRQNKRVNSKRRVMNHKHQIVRKPQLKKRTVRKHNNRRQNRKPQVHKAIAHRRPKMRLGASAPSSQQVWTNLKWGSANVTINGKNDTITVSNGTVGSDIEGMNGILVNGKKQNGEVTADQHAGWVNSSDNTSDISDVLTNLPNYHTDWKIKFNHVQFPSDSSDMFSDSTANVGPNMDGTISTDSFMKNVSSIDMHGADTSHATNMDGMFSNLSATNIILPNTFDTSNVTNMHDMFVNDSDLTNLTLPDSFNTKNVTDMSNMFSDDKSLKSINLGDNFDTSKVNNMAHMFSSDVSLPTVNFGTKFDTHNVTDMTHMFGGDKSITSLKLPANFTTGKVTSMNTMFESCQFSDIDLSHFDTSDVTNMYDMFGGNSRLKHINYGNHFDTKNVKDMNQMFNYDSSYTHIYLPKTFDTREAINFHHAGSDGSNDGDYDMFNSVLPTLVQVQSPNTQFHPDAQIGRLYAQTIHVDKNGRPYTVDTPNNFGKGNQGTYVPEYLSQGTVYVKYVDPTGKVIQTTPVSGQSGTPFNVTQYTNNVPSQYLYTKVISGGNINTQPYGHADLVIQVRPKQLTDTFNFYAGGQLIKTEQKTGTPGQSYNISKDVPSQYNYITPSNPNYYYDGKTHNIQLATHKGTITINYVNPQGKLVSSTSTTNMTGKPFNIQPYTSQVPTNYAYDKVLSGGNINQYPYGSQTVNVQVHLKDTTDTFNFYDGNKLIKSEHKTGLIGYTYDISHDVPSQYNYFTPTNPVYRYDGQTHNIQVAVHKGTIMVHYVDPQGKPVSTVPVTNPTGTPFNLNQYTQNVPSKYVFNKVLNGGNVNQFIYGHQQDVTIQVSPKAVTDTFNFYDGNKLVKSERETGAPGKSYNISKDVPSQYNWINPSNPNYYYDGQTHNIQVATHRGTIIAHYVDQNGNPVGTSSETQLTGTPFNMNQFINNVPPKYLFTKVLSGNNINQFPYGNQSVTIQVRPKAVTDTFNFYSGGKLVKSEQESGLPSQSYNISNDIPSQYSLVSPTNPVYRYDGMTHNVQLSLHKGTITINYFDPSGNNIGKPVVTTGSTGTPFNMNQFSNTIPKGYHFTKALNNVTTYGNQNNQNLNVEVSPNYVPQPKPSSASSTPTGGSTYIFNGPVNIHSGNTSNTTYNGPTNTGYIHIHNNNHVHNGNNHKGRTIIGRHTHARHVVPNRDSIIASHPHHARHTKSASVAPSSAVISSATSAQSGSASLPTSSSTSDSVTSSTVSSASQSTKPASASNTPTSQSAVPTSETSGSTTPSNSNSNYPYESNSDKPISSAPNSQTSSATPTNKSKAQSSASKTSGSQSGLPSSQATKPSEAQSNVPTHYVKPNQKHNKSGKVINHKAKPANKPERNNHRKPLKPYAPIKHHHSVTPKKPYARHTTKHVAKHTTNHKAVSHKGHSTNRPVRKHAINRPHKTVKHITRPTRRPATKHTARKQNQPSIHKHNARPMNKTVSPKPIRPKENIPSGKTATSHKRTSNVHRVNRPSVRHEMTNRPRAKKLSPVNRRLVQATRRAGQYKPASRTKQTRPTVKATRPIMMHRTVGNRPSRNYSRPSKTNLSRRPVIHQNRPAIHRDIHMNRPSTNVPKLSTSKITPQRQFNRPQNVPMRPQLSRMNRPVGQNEQPKALKPYGNRIVRPTKPVEPYIHRYASMPKEFGNDNLKPIRHRATKKHETGKLPQTSNSQNEKELVAIMLLIMSALVVAGVDVYNKKKNDNI